MYNTSSVYIFFQFACASNGRISREQQGLCDDSAINFSQIYRIEFPSDSVEINGMRTGCCRCCCSRRTMDTNVTTNIFNPIVSWKLNVTFDCIARYDENTNWHVHNQIKIWNESVFSNAIFIYSTSFKLEFGGGWSMVNRKSRFYKSKWHRTGWWWWCTERCTVNALCVMSFIKSMKCVKWIVHRAKIHDMKNGAACWACTPSKVDKIIHCLHLKIGFLF